MAADQGVCAADLHRAGIVDRIVPERPDAADEPIAFCQRLGAVIADELFGLLAQDPADRKGRRKNHYRQLGL